MYDHVLVLADEGEASTRAAEDALRLAEAVGARVTLLAAVDEVDAGRFDFLGKESVERVLEEARRGRGAVHLDGASDVAAASPVDVETEVATGPVHEAVCDMVRSEGVDLVVVGGVGQERLADYVLGSTTERINRACEVPVLVV